MSNILALKSFYSGKKVIVTGGCGFVGSHLVDLLEKLGAEVIILDNLSRGVNNCDGKLLYRTDVTRFDECLFWFKKDVFAVFNLAASVAGVLHNMNHNLDMYNENILLQTVPVAAADAAGVKHFLQTSTVCVYSPENNAPSSEEYGLDGTPHQANGGYAESKRDGERAVLWSDLNHAVIVRPSNIFGPRDHFDDKAHVIPALIKRALEEDSDELVLYGPPKATREFVYVTDVAMGMVIALAFGGAYEAYNIGCNDIFRHSSTGELDNVTTMEDLANKILLLTEKEKKVVVNEALGGGDSIRWAHSRKLRSLGWEHEIDLDWGLYETIEYYIDSITEHEV